MIPTDLLNDVLNAALGGGAEFAEVFAEDVERGSVHLDDGRVESLASGRDRGAGIRVVSGESTGFAHTADLSEAGSLACARLVLARDALDDGDAAEAAALVETIRLDGPTEIGEMGWIFEGDPVEVTLLNASLEACVDVGSVLAQEWA